MKRPTLPSITTPVVGSLVGGAVVLLVGAIFVDFALDPLNTRRRWTL